ncbi:MAG TPA: AAA family ATPase [Candidatus Dormibacteraeota bacterium]|nr:AAA family ATPase [Candidatus Dormibacteraeota bacterium]
MKRGGPGQGIISMESSERGANTALEDAKLTGSVHSDQRTAVLTDTPLLPGEVHVLRGQPEAEATGVVGLPGCGCEVVLVARDAYHQRRQPLIGLLAVVDEEEREEGQVRRARAYGLRRVAIVADERQGPVLMVRIGAVDEEAEATDEVIDRLLRLRRLAQRHDSFGGRPDFVPDLTNMNPGTLADWLSVHLSPGGEARLALMNAVRWIDRLPILEALYKGDRSRRRSPRARERRVDTLEDRVRKAPLPPEVRAAVERDLAETGGSHGNGNREAVRIALDLNWEAKIPPAIDLEEARLLLDAEHGGMKEAKRAIVDHLVVLEWQRRNGQNSTTGQVLCLVGPPGTGKTTLAESAAKAMGRRFERISLGGVDDVFLAGADRGYNRARPGEFVRRLRASGAHPSEIVWLLDEIDKLSDWGGHSALSVLLSILDPSQNHAWQDHFLDEVRLDLSGSVFLATANDRNQIPAPLLDRLRCIEVPAYSPEDQVIIAQTRLVPKLLAQLGATDVARIDESALRSLVFDHAQTPGCRQLQQRLQVVIARALELHIRTNLPVLVDAATAQVWVPPEPSRGIGFQPRSSQETSRTRISARGAALSPPALARLRNGLTGDRLFDQIAARSPRVVGGTVRARHGAGFN